MMNHFSVPNEPGLIKQPGHSFGLFSNSADSSESKFVEETEHILRVFSEYSQSILRAWPIRTSYNTKYHEVDLLLTAVCWRVPAGKLRTQEP